MYSWYLNTLDFRFNRKENVKLDFKAELGTEASNLSAQETPSCVASNSALQFSCLFPNLQESQPLGDSMTSFPRASRFSTLNRSFTWIYGGFLLWNPRAVSATLMLQWQGGSSGTERWGTLSTPAEWWKKGGGLWLFWSFSTLSGGPWPLSQVAGTHSLRALTIQHSCL